MTNILVRATGKGISIILKQAAGGYYASPIEGQQITLAISQLHIWGILYKVKDEERMIYIVK